MIVKLLTERHLEFLSLKGGCTDSSESTLVKMSNCWKSRALAHFVFTQLFGICHAEACAGNRDQNSRNLLSRLLHRPRIQVLQVHTRGQ